MRLQFVNTSSHEVSPSTGRPESANNDERRRRIRTHVMRDFRRKERLLNTQHNQQADQESESRDRVVQCADRTVLVPRSIHSPQMWRFSFARVLIDGWFPNDMGYAPLNSIIYTYAAHDSVPVIAIHDALLLLHAGSITGNEDLLLEARKRYIVAVSGLRVHANQVGPSTPLENILLAAMGVLMSETYSAISVPTAWQRHIVGLSALVSAYQQESRNSLAEQYLLQQIWTAQLIYSLCTRKPFHDNLAITRMSTSSTRVDRLLDLASDVPQLLQDVDTVIGTEHGETRKASRKRLLDQRHALSSWLSAFRASNGHDGIIWDDFDSKADTHPRTTKSLLCELTCESLCYICLLLLTEGIHDLELPRSLSDSAIQDIGRYARPLRDTISRVAEAAAVPICAARAVSGPLFFLTRTYARTEDVDGLRWCRQVQETCCEQATYLRWDALLPWSLVTLYEIADYDAGVNL